VIERDAAGRPLRMIGTHTDISLRKEAEMMRREREHAAEAQKAQNAFLSRVSHELRTPLNAIIGFAQLLDLEPADSVRRPLWVRTILDSGRQLLALVNDLLDLSSARTGLLQFTRSAVALGPLLREVWVLHATDAAVAGIGFADPAAATSGLGVMADPRRLRQVLSNLLSNAIKYNRPGGRVLVTALRDGDAVTLSVEDDGPGLDAAQRERLFHPFERLGAQHTTIAGTGLGLALARQLVEAMGGSIEAHSAPGRGSRFTVRLEAAPATPQADAATASAART
jgi:signal transduction histidine kinase